MPQSYQKRRQKYSFLSFWGFESTCYFFLCPSSNSSMKIWVMWIPFSKKLSYYLRLFYVEKIAPLRQGLKNVAFVCTIRNFFFPFKHVFLRRCLRTWTVCWFWHLVQGVTEEWHFVPDMCKDRSEVYSYYISIWDKDLKMFVHGAWQNLRMFTGLGGDKEWPQYDNGKNVGKMNSSFKAYLWAHFFFQSRSYRQWITKLGKIKYFMLLEITAHRPMHINLTSYNVHGVGD